jgi:hypothetical protein
MLVQSVMPAALSAVAAVVCDLRRDQGTDGIVGFPGHGGSDAAALGSGRRREWLLRWAPCRTTL